MLKRRSFLASLFAAPYALPSSVQKSGMAWLARSGCLYAGRKAYREVIPIESFPSPDRQEEFMRLFIRSAQYTNEIIARVQTPLNLGAGLQNLFPTEPLVMPELHDAFSKLLSLLERDSLNVEARDAYQKAAALLADAEASGVSESNGVSKNRVVVDMTGGLFNGATSVLPLEILVIDTDDPEHVRANVPHFGDGIWADTCSAEVNPEAVNAAFDGFTWLCDDESASGDDTSTSSPV
jgi:hypothetical protein